MSARRFLRHVLTRRFAVAACTVLSLAVPAVVSVSLAGQSRSTGGDFPAYRAPRLDGHPDLNGIWQAFVTANVDLEDHDARPGPHPELMGAYGAEPPGQSIVEGGRIPYQPSALARKKENFETR